MGSQLIAKTFGAKVYRGSQKEIGFYNDLKIYNNSSFFSDFTNPFTVFHWHDDTFDLPEGAVRLASSEHYLNQTFQYKSAVGLQFHLEVNEEMVNLWLDKKEEKLKNPLHRSTKNSLRYQQKYFNCKIKYEKFLQQLQIIIQSLIKVYYSKCKCEIYVFL